MKRAVLSAFCLLTIGLGCSSERNPRDLLAPGDLGTIVVDAQLIVGQRFPVIRLKTTQSPNEPYDGYEAGLRGATVAIFTPSGDLVGYLDDGGGTYIPYALSANMVDLVLPQTTYRLRVETADRRRVTAQTTTPDTFSVRDWLLLDDPSLAIRRSLATYDDFTVRPDSVYIADSNQLIYQDGLVEARFDRGQAIAFQVGIFSLDHGSPVIVDADFIDPGDLATLPRDSSSPVFNAPDGFLRLPWFAIFFEGRYRIAIYSVDRNWYDLARSSPFVANSNIGFGTNAGDDFERPIFHVEGGIGLFGSAAVDDNGFRVLPRP